MSVLNLYLRCRAGQREMNKTNMTNDIEHEFVVPVRGVVSRVDSEGARVCRKLLLYMLKEFKSMLS